MLLHKMRKTSGVTANVINISTATSACKQEDQWQQTLALLIRCANEA